MLTGEAAKPSLQIHHDPVNLTSRSGAPSRKSSGVQVAPADFAALKALHDELGAQFRAGILFYLGDDVVPFGDKLWLMPVQVLWAS